MCVCVRAFGFGLSNKRLGLEINTVNWLVDHFKSRNHWSLRFLGVCIRDETIFIV